MMTRAVHIGKEGGHTNLEAYAEGAGHGPELAGAVQVVVPHSRCRGSLGPAGCNLVPQAPADLQQAGHYLGLGSGRIQVAVVVLALPAAICGSR